MLFNTNFFCQTDIGNDIYRTSRTFMKRFADAGGSIKCVEIKDRLAEEHSRVKRDVHCTNVVENATQILAELL